MILNIPRFTKQHPFIVTPLALIFVVLMCSFVFLSHNTAHATASGSNFNAGYIISDSTFYNSGTMNVTAIQNFLNAQVPTCDTNGTAIYSGSMTDAQYAASQGWPGPPYVCLRNYTQNTPAMAADSYCGATPARTGTSGAQIIADVSSACGINPQVMLVLIQKEQGLVADTWPLNSEYLHATGFACSDSAPCDSSYAGFFYQVYYAAHQFKIYQAKPNNYSYVAGQTNHVYYQTNLGNFVNPTGNATDSSRNGQSGCGYSNVYIQNQATAALYIYTPYQPNQTALANLYGSGDGCSAYGNRNFWRYFTDWFGSTTSAPVSNLILSNGTYEFTNPASGKSLDVSGGGTANGTAVQLYTTNHTNSQRWQITLGADGYYTLMNVGSGKYLDVTAGSLFSGTKLQIYTGNGSCAQEWSIVSSGSNVELLSKCSNLAIDISGGNFSNGTRLQVYNVNSTVSQLWSPISVATPALNEGLYTISSSGSLNLNLTGGATTNNTPVQIYTPGSTESQYWQINRLANGFYTIRNPNSNKYLDDTNASTTSGAAAQVYSKTTSCSQQWAITAATGGSYTIRSACSSLVLDIPGGAVSTSGTSIQLYTNNSSAAQRWTMSPLSAGTIPNGTYSLRTTGGLALDIIGGSTANGARLQVYTPNGTGAQQWQFVKQSNGTFTISNPASGRYIDLPGASLVAGNALQIYTGNGTCAQQWQLTQNTDSSYTISQGCSSGTFSIDVAGGKITTPSTKTQLYNTNHSVAQNWIFGTP